MNKTKIHMDFLCSVSHMTDSNKMDYTLINKFWINLIPNKIVISLFSANLWNIIISPKFVLFKNLHTALYYQRGSCRIKSIPINFFNSISVYQVFIGVHSLSSTYVKTCWDLTTSENLGQCSCLTYCCCQKIYRQEMKPGVNKTKIYFC